jgi:TolA-binding protein
MNLTADQATLLFGELIAVLAAIALLIRALSSVMTNRSKVDSLKAQVESDREGADTRTRLLVNELMTRSDAEVHDLRKLVISLQLDNARYAERETFSDARMGEMQTRIDTLITKVAELSVKLNHAESITKQQQDIYERRLADKDTEITRISTLYTSCLEAREGAG